MRRDSPKILPLTDISEDIRLDATDFVSSVLCVNNPYIYSIVYSISYIMAGAVKGKKVSCLISECCKLMCRSERRMHRPNPKS
jgi:hypothetical protein